MKVRDFKLMDEIDGFLTVHPPGKTEQDSLKYTKVTRMGDSAAVVS